MSTHSAASIEPNPSRAVGWRSLVVSQPAKLSLHNRQLLLENRDGGVRVPLEDIAVVMLETPQALITSALLSALAATGAAVVTCDEAHHPNGALLPYLPHSRHLRVFRAQSGLSEPQKKRAWQAIVQCKLRNQAKCLDLCAIAGGDFLRGLAAKVTSGDTVNREGQGAQRYFAWLFGDGFTRQTTEWRNSALDYGYAVIRAVIARALVAHGFHTAVGLHHRSELNAFNLADDFIEPFRPVVDRCVARQVVPDENKLTPSHKAMLAGILYRDVAMPNGTMNILAAVDATVQSFLRVVEAGAVRELHLPQLLS